jgi:hypothetical protein
MSWERASVTLPTLGHPLQGPLARPVLEDAHQLALGDPVVAVPGHLDEGEDDGCDGDNAQEREENEHESAFQEGWVCRLTEAPLLVFDTSIRPLPTMHINRIVLH